MRNFPLFFHYKNKYWDFSFSVELDGRCSKNIYENVENVHCSLDYEKNEVFFFAHSKLSDRAESSSFMFITYVNAMRNITVVVFQSENTIKTTHSDESELMQGKLSLQDINTTKDVSDGIRRENEMEYYGKINIENE